MRKKAKSHTQVQTLSPGNKNRYLYLSCLGASCSPSASCMAVYFQFEKRPSGKTGLPASRLHLP